MNIFIIGGKGFIGSRLSKRLLRKNINTKVGDIAISESEINYKNIFLDVTDRNTLDVIKGSDTIINLAAEHRDNIKPISRYEHVNVIGAINTCNAARDNNVNRIIFTSSVAVYGFAPNNTKENGKINYFNDYGRTKYEAEQIYIKWYLEKPSKRSLIIIRPTVVFGEGNRGNIYNLMKSISSKRFVMIGHGKNVKSIAYVENVAAFIEHCLDIKGLHTFNYIDKPDMDMNTLVKKIRFSLFESNNVGIRIPSYLAKIIGILFDLISFLLKKEFSISSIRIKKFMANSQFDSSIRNTKFIAPVNLTDAIEMTLKNEFK